MADKRGLATIHMKGLSGTRGVMLYEEEYLITYDKADFAVSAINAR